MVQNLTIKREIPRKQLIHLIRALGIPLDYLGVLVDHTECTLKPRVVDREVGLQIRLHHAVYAEDILSLKSHVESSPLRSFTRTHSREQIWELDGREDLSRRRYRPAFQVSACHIGAQIVHGDRILSAANMCSEPDGTRPAGSEQYPVIALDFVNSTPYAYSTATCLSSTRPSP